MDYAWVDNKVSSGTGWQVRKEENQVQSCPHSELTEFVLMIIVSLTPMTLAGVFYRKSSFSGHSCSFQFHTFTHIHTHARGSARTSYIFSSVSLWLRTHTHTHTHTLNPVILDTRPLDAACIFYESGERWKLCPSLKCVSESRTEKTPSLRSDVRWFDNSRAAPGHWWRRAL